MLRSAFARAGLVLLALAGAACSGDSGAPTQPGPPASVALSSSTFTFVALGASQAVSATVSDASGRALTAAPLVWSSEDPSIAAVTASGESATIVAHKSGSTTVKATSGTITATISVTVLGIKAVAFLPFTSTMRPGDTQSLAIDITADAGVSRTVTWTSNNVAVATLNASGVVTALAPGAVAVTATAAADPTVLAVAQLTVLPLRGVVVAPASATLAIGGTQQFSASVAIDAGLPTTVAWSSSAPGVVSVSQLGVVTATGLGNATVTATSTVDGSLKGTALVSVVPIVRLVTIASPPAGTFFLGQSQTLTASVTADAGLAQTVTWKSSNTAVATVGATGSVTAMSAGTAAITATSTVDSTKSASVLITAASRPVSVSVAPVAVTLVSGSTATVVATVTGDPAVSRAVSWSSSANGVATVTNGLITAVSNGSAVVTATSVADPTKSATVSVSVGPRLAAAWSSTGLGGVMIENIISTYAISSTNVFTVNSRGDVFHFDGTGWTRSAQGAAFGTTFASVHGTSGTNVIAVGTGGKIAQWDGTSWQARTSGTSADLNDVWVESSTSAFAVGNNGTAVRLIGTTWAPTATSSTQRLNGVWAAGGNAWIAVGAGGELLRFSNGSWTRIVSPTSVTLRDVYGTASNDVYAVGEVGTVLRFDGGTWTILASNGIGSNLYTVSGTSVAGGRIYIGGDRIALQVANGVLSPMPVDAPYSVQFLSASVDGSGALWMGGERGLMMRNAGSNWDTMNIAPDLIDVWSTGVSNAWAVGEFGFIYRFNGTQWSRQTSPTLTRLNSVWGSSASDAFAGGDGGLILRWNGSAWTSIASPTSADILSMWGTAKDNVYAATYAGEVLHWNGAAWSVVTTQANALYAVFGSNANDVYAAGDAGTVLRFNGASWTALNTTGGALLAGVWSSAPNNVFAVGVLGGAGAAYRYGTAWQRIDPGVTVELTAVWGPAAADLYVSGAAGTILRFDGLTWQNMPTGTTEFLWSITGDPAGQGAGFAVGFNSTLVTGVPTGTMAGVRSLAMSRVAGTLEPSPEAVRMRRTVRPLPHGAARQSRR